MKQDQQITFLPFRLDTVNECLWRGSRMIYLRQKTFAVLRYLVAYPGRLVTKEELFEAVWPDAYVSDVVLKVCVRELRKVLGDEPNAPRFIETVHRRGYRFIGKITEADRPDKPLGRRQSAVVHPQLTPVGLVGRGTELEQLQRWLDKALGGERQLVFVTGEVGIGKTALVEAFVERVSTDKGLWVGRGQCIEHYGAGEAYMPVLEALGRLCHVSGSKRLVRLLGQQAPTWLVQMPALISASEREALQRAVMGATRDRMLREMAEMLEALTADVALVLVLEDLQWSDYSTLELISLLAQRRERARLLVIGTYRPVAVSASGHPLKVLKQELQIHRHCGELPLEFLTESVVAEYLAERFPGRSLPAALARVVHQRTDGNPLFMVNMVDYLVGQALVVKADGRWEVRVGLGQIAVGVPESLRQVIEKQVEGLSVEEQRVLEAASIAGVEFSAAAVAAGLEEEEVEVEERCGELVRRGQFLRLSGSSEWPDGTVAGRYGFIHSLYQNVLCDRVTVGRRIQLHRRIGEREEVGYGERAGEIAGELAVHFEEGRDYRRAVQYLRQAAENALWRYAYQEAIGHLTKGLELLKTLPDTPERTQQELTLQTALGVPLVMTKGYAAPEVEKAYTRAWELCRRIGETPELFRVLRGLRTFYLTRGEFHKARELGEQLLTLAQSQKDPALLLSAYDTLGIILFHLGELAPARAHLEQGIALYDPQKHRSHAFVQDPGVVCLAYMAFILWFLGYPDQALKRIHEALTLAQELSHPHSLAYALGCAAVVHQLCQKVQAAQEQAEAAIALSRGQGFAYWLAMGTILRGWALAGQGEAEEGIAQIRQGLTAWRATGAETMRPYFLALLTEAYEKAGRAEEGLNVLAEALDVIYKTGERFYEAELHRLKGELLLAQESKNQKRFPRCGVPTGRFPAGTKGKNEDVSETEECFRQALDIARRQSAKSLELRAVMSLGRLLHRQGKGEEARQLLAEICGWFTEGFDPTDLQEARALLAELL